MFNLLFFVNDPEDRSRVCVEMVGLENDDPKLVAMWKKAFAHLEADEIVLEKVS